MEVGRISQKTAPQPPTTHGDKSMTVMGPGHLSLPPSLSSREEKAREVLKEHTVRTCKLHSSAQRRAPATFRDATGRRRRQRPALFLTQLTNAGQQCGVLERKWPQGRQQHPSTPSPSLWGAAPTEGSWIGTPEPTVGTAVNRRVVTAHGTQRGHSKKMLL